MNNDSIDYIKAILTASVYDVAIKTPLDAAPNLSGRLDAPVFLKREDLQPVFSFKIRGAYNKIARLSPEERAAGVITSSAGNHAQGVALSATRLGLRSLIVMPKTTPQIKVDAVRRLGGQTVLHGETYGEAYHHALLLAREDHMTFIHAYDDPDVIAGQGTIGQEMLQQHPAPIEAIFVPVGGGGLIAGIGVYVKYLRPEIRVIGVEPADTPSMYEALRQNKRVRLDQVGLFADGVAVEQVGREPFRLARECVDEVILVSTDEICAAIRDIYEDTRAIAEPAGGLAVAGIKAYAATHTLSGQALLGVIGGANMNFDRLGYVAERTELGEHREALLAVTIAEEPGSFRRFCHDVSEREITEFNYRYEHPQEAHVFAGIHLQHGPAEKDQLIAELRAKGYPVLDMTDNELAKVHIRHMVGGHAPHIPHEMLFRVAFPQRIGALQRFLNRLGQRWNITLFHYRNHGADHARVMVGMQVPPEQQHQARSLLYGLGYPCHEETDNPAYRLFLGTAVTMPSLGSQPATGHVALGNSQG